jgi:hypothetical protein
MHQPLDAPGVKRAMRRPGYRVWFVRKPDAPFPAAITHVRVQSTAGERAPVTERNERLFLGTVPSHGIIEPLRARFPEFVFDPLPQDTFVLVVGTSGGTQRFTVTQRERTALMRVCN